MVLSRERTRLIARLRSRRARERERLVLVEGIRSAAEALTADAHVRFAVISDRLSELAGGLELHGRLAAAGIQPVEIAHDELDSISDTITSQGVLLVCAEPRPRCDALPSGPLLVLDGIQDPGNVGTLVRAAVAFGLGGTVVLDGTADPFGAKAVRAAAGATFRMPVLRDAWDRIGTGLRRRGPLLVGEVSGRDVGDTKLAGEWALVIGSEAAGPRAAVRSAATETVAVPMAGGVASLNAGVAGAILLYVLTREGRRG